MKNSCFRFRYSLHEICHIWASSDPYFPVYDSVLKRENADMIRYKFGKIWIRESPHFRIFYAMIRKKYQFQIKPTSRF